MNPASHRTALTLAIGGAVAMAAAFGFGRFVYTPILPHMIADGLTPSAAGFVAAANYLGYLAGGFVGITGLMQARARAWFLGGIAISGLTMIAMAFTHDVWIFAVLRFIGGAGGTTVMVAGASLLFAPLMVADGGRFALAPFLGPGLGIAASSFVVALLDRAGADWQTMWIVTGVIASAATLLVMACLPRAAAAATASGAHPGHVRWSRRLVLLTLSYGLFGFGYIVTATFIVVITRETPALAFLEPYIWAIVGLSGAASIFFWTAMVRRFGEVPVYVVGCLTEAVGVALSVVDPSPRGIILAAVFVGGTFVAITAIGLQIGRRLAGGAPQKIQAAMTVAFGIGQVVGPLLAGMLRESSGTFLAPSLAAAAALAIGAVLSLVP